MREEAAHVGVRTSPEVVDRSIGDAATTKLNADQCREVAVWLRAGAVDDFHDTSRALHFCRHLFADLEGADADVRADRYDELGWVVGKRLDPRGHDPSDCAAPTGMHRSHMSAWRVPYQDWDAIRSTCRNSVLSNADDQPVPLDVGDRFRTIAGEDLANRGSMHLSLFEKAIACETDCSQEAFAVFADCVLVVAKMIPEVQRIVGRAAHASAARCETVTKAMSIQKGRVQDGHTVFHITTTLRHPQLRAKKRSFAT
jgi:hypothetical protein